ncbi:MAG: helicase C-terminal domain-containing protein, partial [Flavobacterium sp.]
DPKHAGSEWYLKAHAEKDFWRWISSWSISMRKPSDLGFSDTLHVLPGLIEKETVIRNVNPLAINGQGSLFALPAQNFFEIKAEVRSTIHQRCEKAVEKASEHDVSVYWVNLNDEADLISKLDKNTYEVKGKMDIDEKEEILMAFSSGEIKKLITKTSITAFGLNWQHCNHATYFPTYSWEQYYQAVRRFWRFGQKRNVLIDLILSDGQTKIMESLVIKKGKAINMFENLTKQANSDFNIDKKLFDKQIQLPTFIK